jgi:hypothetical protein
MRLRLRVQERLHDLLKLRVLRRISLALCRCHMTEPHLLDDDHFRAFGAIIHVFARHETLMVGAISKLLGADIVLFSMVAAELPYRGKRDTLLALIKEKPLPDDQIEKLSGYLGELHKWNKLRNAIAHSVWKPGGRPGSIKPMGLSVRGGETTYTGIEPDERDYTKAELISIGNQLISLRLRFFKYLQSIALLPTMEDIAAAVDDRP